MFFALRISHCFYFGLKMWLGHSEHLSSVVAAIWDLCWDVNFSWTNLYSLRTKITNLKYGTVINAGTYSGNLLSKEKIRRYHYMGIVLNHGSTYPIFLTLAGGWTDRRILLTRLWILYWPRIKLIFEILDDNLSPIDLSTHYKICLKSLSKGRGPLLFIRTPCSFYKDFINGVWIVDLP